MSLALPAATRRGTAALTWHRPAVVVAGLAVVLTGLRVPVYRSLTVGAIFGLLLIPVWWSSIARFRGGRPIVWLGLASGASGLWLTWASEASHETPSRLLMANEFILLDILVGIAVLLWARTLIPTASTAALFAIGMVGSALTGGAGLSLSAYRFTYATPIAILVLALAWRSQRLWPQAAAALALSAAIGLAGGRSDFALLLMTAVLAGWQASTARTRAGSRVRIAVLGLALVFGIYQVGQGLILDGYLGASAQQRSVAQIATSGNILLGARPEMAATIALIAHHPPGFGAGVAPSLSDVTVAKDGMSQIGYNPNNNGYVDHYMFGSAFELHSILGDMWARYGLLGLALAVVLLCYAASSVMGLAARRVAPALLIYLAIRLAWNTFFGPIWSAATLITAAIGLALAVKTADSRRIALDPPELGASAPG